MIDWFSNLTAAQIIGWWAIIRPVVMIFAIAIAGYVAIRLLNRLVMVMRGYLSRGTEGTDRAKRMETLGRVIRYVASVVIAALTVTLILDQLGISVAPILATAGVVGLAVGFGAQNLVRDYFTGLFLLLEDQIRQGDIVDAGGKAGVVEEVTLRYVRMRDYDGNVHFVPNGTITTVTNMTREFAFSKMDIGVAYRENLDDVIAVIRAAAEEFRQDPVFGPKILEPLEVAGVEAWADSAVIIRTRFRVKPIEQWGVRREFMRRLKNRFDAEGIEIPYPHVTIYAGRDKEGQAPALPLEVTAVPSGTALAGAQSSGADPEDGGATGDATARAAAPMR